MKLLVQEITETPKSLSFEEEIGELNLIYRESGARDFRFPPALEVDLVCYRSGRELFFSGSFRGIFEGCCARCLRNYKFSLARAFEFVLAPEPVSTKKKELSWEEMGLSYYATEEINLAPLIREQVLLALPTRPLCNERCRGLCAGCGANLNEEPCLCPSRSEDPRLAFFRSLKIGQ